MINVAVLGAGGALGCAVTSVLIENPSVNVTCVVRDKRSSAENEIYWDYRSALPAQLKESDVVVNCARSKNFVENIAFNRILIRMLPVSVKLINISSNAVFAKPRGKFGWLFKGDAYIREKKAIERESAGLKNASILRPTLVCDEGNWKEFLMACESAARIVGPFGCEKSKVKISSRAHIARVIEACVIGNADVPKELFESVVPVSKLLDKNPLYQGKSYNFFDSFSKNILCFFLTSWLIPDSVAYSVQTAILKRKDVPVPQVSESDLIIEGMTRLYLFGTHTT